MELMTPTEYMTALSVVGILRNLPAHELDRQAAELLKVDERTARRYRRGEQAIPGPVALALNLLVELRSRQSRNGGR
jgi:hypothetical protein